MRWGPCITRKPLSATAPGRSQSGRDHVCGRPHMHEPQQHPRLCHHLPPCCMQAPAFLWPMADPLEPELEEGPLCAGHHASTFRIPAHMDPHEGRATSDTVFGQCEWATKLGGVGSARTRITVQVSHPCGPICQLKVLPGISLLKD